MKVANKGAFADGNSCDECREKMYTQRATDVLEVTVGGNTVRICTHHFAELLVLGRSSLPRASRALA